MMLAYQPVRSLATLTLQSSKDYLVQREFAIIDDDPEIKDNDNSELLLNNGNVVFNKIKFQYSNDDKHILNNIDLDIPGKKMTALVGQSGCWKIYFLT